MKNGKKEFKHKKSNYCIMHFVCLFATPTQEVGDELSIYCLGLYQSVSGLLQRARREFTSLATSTRLWLVVAFVLVVVNVVVTVMVVMMLVVYFMVVFLVIYLRKKSVATIFASCHHVSLEVLLIIL